jgi:hypothetical protein
MVDFRALGKAENVALHETVERGGKGFSGECVEINSFELRL